MVDSTRPAWRSRWAWVAFLIPAMAGLALDLWSKAAAFAWLLQADPNSPHPSAQIIAGMMRFTLQTNRGMAFGLPVLPYLIQAATGIAIAAVVYFFASSPARARWTHVALGLIAGGALGNLYDRLGLPGPTELPGAPSVTGQVRDFVDFGQIGYRWVFNVADALLVAGVLILLVAWIADHLRRNKGPVPPAHR